MAIINGTNGNDDGQSGNPPALIGTAGDDTINGFNGNDVLDGGAGNDVLNGGNGVDTITGGDGNDVITGGPVGDNGSAGVADTINAGAGNDTVYFLSFNYANINMGTGLDDLLVIDLSGTVVVGGVPQNCAMGGNPLTADANGWSGSLFQANGQASMSFAGVDRFQITGSSLADNFYTGSGNDVVNSGDGNDNVDVGSGNDQANGGAGLDRISADMSAATTAVLWDLVANTYSGPGGSNFSNFEQFGTLRTGSGNDVIRTASLLESFFNSEYIYTGAGSDTVTIVRSGAGAGTSEGIDMGTGSDDRLVLDLAGVTVGLSNNLASGANGFSGTLFYPGGLGTMSWSAVDHFTISTGSGADTILTGSGNDVVNSGSGNDTVDVGTGLNQADGGAGLDRISVDMSTASAAVLWDLVANTYSGPGGTSFSNFEQFGTLRTGSGNDVIKSASLLESFFNSEYIYTGGGSDTVTMVRSGSNLGTTVGIDMGTGTDDRLVLDLSGVTVGLSNSLGSDPNGFGGTLYYPGGTGVISWGGVDHFTILAGSSNDSFTTGTGNDYLDGDDGNDNLNGGGGIDTLLGGNGADALDGGDGNDFLYGGAGADSLTGGTGFDYAIYSGSSTGLVVDLATPAGNSGEAAGDTFSGIEGLIGSGFNDILRGDAGDNWLYGGNGSDVLFGRDGADVLLGEGGIDYLYGDAGADNLIGGTGDDHLTGGAGADILNGGDGFDYAHYDSAPAGLTVDMVNNADNTGEAVGDFFAGIEAVVGSAFDDSIRGNDQTNWLYGGAGNDFLYGRAGLDYLLGGAGNDYLFGGAGTDVLYGEAGADRFVFANGDGIDYVMDFSHAQGDVLYLSAASLGVSNFADVQARMVQSGGDTVIGFGANAIMVVVGVTPAQFVAADFVFG